MTAKLTLTDSLMVAFFAANVGASVRDFYQSLKAEDVGGEDAIRTLATCVHSRATRLWAQGILTRTLRVDASGQEVWTYSIAPEGTTGTGAKGKGYKAMLEAEREAWAQEREDMADGVALYKLAAEKAEAARDAEKARADALAAENAKLMEWLEKATA